jgi:hypothetical protein
LAVYGRPEKALNQGDIFPNVPFYSRQVDGSFTLLTVPGLVLTHSCDIDKYDEVKGKLSGNQKKRWPIQMLPLLSPADLDKGALGDTKAGRHKRYFFIPKEDRHQELVADFWLAQPVPILDIQKLTRLATLSEEYLARLWSHAIVAVSRKEPQRLFEGGRLAS